ncbi:MAG: hypothetical protein Q9175_007098 [Cornicularia normoerica]
MSPGPLAVRTVESMEGGLLVGATSFFESRQVRQIARGTPTRMANARTAAPWPSCGRDSCMERAFGEGVRAGSRMEDQAQPRTKGVNDAAHTSSRTPQEWKLPQFED